MITPDEINDQKEHLNGAGKDTYRHTDNKRTADDELRPQWDSDWLANWNGCERINLAADDDLFRGDVGTSAQAHQRGFHSSGEPPAHDGQGTLPIDDADSPGTLHRAYLTLSWDRFAALIGARQFFTVAIAFGRLNIPQGKLRRGPTRKYKLQAQCNFTSRYLCGLRMKAWSRVYWNNCMWYTDYYQQTRKSGHLCSHTGTPASLVNHILRSASRVPGDSPVWCAWAFWKPGTTMSIICNYT